MGSDGGVNGTHRVKEGISGGRSCFTVEGKDDRDQSVIGSGSVGHLISSLLLFLEMPN